jgi:hypothetical protein
MLSPVSMGPLGDLVRGTLRRHARPVHPAAGDPWVMPGHDPQPIVDVRAGHARADDVRKGNRGGADMSQLDWKAEYRPRPVVVQAKWECPGITRSPDHQAEHLRGCAGDGHR